MSDYLMDRVEAAAIVEQMRRDALEGAETEGVNCAFSMRDEDEERAAEHARNAAHDGRHALALNTLLYIESKSRKLMEPKRWKW